MELSKNDLNFTLSTVIMFRKIQITFVLRVRLGPQTPLSKCFGEREGKELFSFTFTHQEAVFDGED